MVKDCFFAHLATFSMNRAITELIVNNFFELVEKKISFKKSRKIEK